MKTIIGEHYIRIYPQAEPDAEEKDIFLDGCVEILTAPILRDTPEYAMVRPNYAFDARTGISRERWDQLNEAMQEAFKISEALKKGGVL